MALFRADPARPFQLVKFFSWSALLLILGTGVVLSISIGNYARRTSLDKQQEFSRLLAENLNHQIYRRFTLPTILGFGRIELQNDIQFDRLDKVVRNTIHSFRVMSVRIYDSENVVSYSTDPALVGREDLSDFSVRRAYTDGVSGFELLNRVGTWEALFLFPREPESFVLRTIYPLRAEKALGEERNGPIMGVLEFTQDITEDYQTIIIFQWLITLVIFVCSLLLFLLLFRIIRRADSIMGVQREVRNNLERELHQNEKLASMGRMVASIAHELRNPLGIIRSTTQLLSAKAAKQNDPNHKLLEAVHDESVRLSLVLNDFLDYARPKIPRKETVSLDQVLDRLTAFLQAEADKHGVVFAYTGDRNVDVSGDKDLLYRAFYNVVGNAIQAMDKGGTITLHVERAENGVRLVITDQGPGFDEHLLEKYLEPFFTTRDKGTGLGLAIAANIVRSHAGSMSLDNAPGGGARVTVTLPSA